MVQDHVLSVRRHNSTTARAEEELFRSRLFTIEFSDYNSRNTHVLTVTEECLFELASRAKRATETISPGDFRLRRE